MTPEEKLEKIREISDLIVFAWQKFPADNAHGTDCYLIHPKCAALTVLAVLDDDKYERPDFDV